MTTVTPSAPATRTELQRILEVQRTAHLAEGSPSAAVRRDRIQRLLLAILESADELAATLDEEYGRRPGNLTKVLDILGAVQLTQDETLANLEEWMAPEPKSGGYIQKKPLGVVGVIGPWNFPVELAIHPAIDALAAGNRVMIKFTDFFPRTGEALARAVAARLDESEVAVVVGDLETAQAFSELHFDHIVFTGSPKVGAIVAEVAGRNLIPTTLELGGKNPVIVSREADLALTAHRVATARMFNSGQVCLCPDYVFVPRDRVEEFTTAVLAEFDMLFPDYFSGAGAVSIVSDGNFDRVCGLIDDAVAKGAQRLMANGAGTPTKERRLIPPTVLLDVPDTAAIASEEIFGPVLAVYPYDDLDEVIRYINDRPVPLAAYWFGSEGSDLERFLDRTSSGGVTVNDLMAHCFLGASPFGGVGNSGSGAYHGKSGFDRLSHHRTIAVASEPQGFTDSMVGPGLESAEFAEFVDGAIQQGVAALRADVERP
ncbi:aldehyde dehydrogenase family protein [Rhodococcus jostii]|uniref:aldehyde dehydrogenase family protein n=1 Tax=Rhodococcus jostii TaxID=132919 RepID=UPI00364DDE3F